MSESTISAKNPPLGRAMRAAFDAAATTLGSSTAMGARRSLPFTRTLSAMPNGKLYVPTTFSTSLSARSESSPPPASAAESASSSTPARSHNRARRSSIESR
jgi:hypothetical protein